ncbi:hypothetical protein GW750_03685 [bacterium]|nr:hypothetical protein [bacterium]
MLVDRRTLQPEEYEIGYIKVDETLDIEVQDGMVVAMDPTITPELELE